MKKKLLAVMLIVVMVLASAVTAFAAEEKGSITISNAANGEEYTVVKLFDAVNAKDSTGKVTTVNYKGTIPAAVVVADDPATDDVDESLQSYDLNNYFEKQEDTVDGVVLRTDDKGADAFLNGKTRDDLFKDLQKWAEANKASGIKKTASGGALVFDNLDLGYYVVLSSQGANISVDSANPNVTIVDKNTKEPTLKKTINDHDVCIGDTVTYTVVADAPNYLEGTKKVVSYQFKDTLPAFISDIRIQTIKVVDKAGTHVVYDKDTDEANKDSEGNYLGKTWTPNAIEAISWIDASGNHIYKNDAKIEIVYTAVVTAQATEGGGVATTFGGNINIITMIPKVDNGGPEYEDYEREWKDEEYTKTYAVALIKTNDETEAKRLAGAKFQVKGLVVTGADGEYTVVSYDPAAANYEGATEMVTGTDGTIIIHGLASDVTLKAQETEAPAGYNKLSGEFDLTPQIVSKEIKRTTTIQQFATVEKGTCKTPEDWNKYITSTTVSTEEEKIEYNTDLVAQSLASNTVINKKGTELPGTGGIGTTILYTLGAILVVGAGVLLVARRKMER